MGWEICFSQDMKVIIITWPQFLPHEADAIRLMLDMGVHRVHLRKPDSTPEECAELLQAIPSSYLPRIVLHDHFSLTQQFAVGGVHLNRRNKQAPEGWQGSVSRSCHGIEELKAAEGKYDYCFLSPIFDSISKQGYHSAYSKEELTDAARSGLLNERVGALGGVCLKNLDEVADYHFGYAALLGEPWQHFQNGDLEPYLRELIQQTQQLTD